MTAIRSRAILTDEARPKLKKHVRLQYDSIRQAWALLAPEKIFWPDETSLAILKHCTGDQAVSDIVAQLADEFEAEEAAIRPDVEEFLQNWADRSLVAI